MPWYGWFALVVYLLGALYCWRSFAWIVAQDAAAYSGTPSLDDIVGGMIIGAFGAMIWPVFVVGGLLHRNGLLHGGARALIAEPRHQRKRRELDDREQNIARLERELGIGR